MKVTVVSHDVGPVSGMERQLAALVDGLVARGVGVRVVARTCEVEARDDVEHVRVGRPARPFTVAFPAFAAQAARAVRRRDGDVIHVAGCLAPIRADVVAIHFLHAAAARAGAGPRLDHAPLPYRLNQAIAAREFLAAERWQLRPGRHRRLVAVSGGLADEIARFYPESVPAAVIPNGIDVERFRPGPADDGVRRALAPPGTTRLAVFVGGGWGPKGLVEAVRALPDAPSWGLAVVGIGDEAPIRSEAAALGAEHRLVFAGMRTDLPDVYRSADALVLPSAYETFSLVAHEAAASGCPVVATRVNGVTDVVSDGESGFLVEREGASIAAALRRVEALSPEERSTLCERARGAVVGRTTEAMVAAHLDLYQGLAEGSAPR